MSETSNVLGVILVAFLGLLYLLGLCLFLRNKRKTASRQYHHLTDNPEGAKSNSRAQFPPNAQNPENGRKKNVTNEPDNPSSRKLSNDISLENPKTDRSEIDLLSKRQDDRSRLLKDNKLGSTQNKGTNNPKSAGKEKNGASQENQGELIQKKQVTTPRDTSASRRSCCFELSLDFYRFHLFGSLVYLCKKRDSSFFFLQLLMTMAFYLFLLFVLANLVNYQNLVWTKTWTVAVSIIVSLIITLIVMMTINYWLLSYQRKQQNSVNLNQGLLQAQSNEEEDLEALEFTLQSQKCGIFDFIGVLMVIFFFIIGIVAAYDLWFLSGTEAGWVLLSFVITLIVDLFVLRPLSITVVAAVRSTYFKSVDPTGSASDSGVREGDQGQGGLNENSSKKAQGGSRKLSASRSGYDPDEKDLHEVNIVTNEDGTKLVEGGIQAYAIVNNDPKAKKQAYVGKVEAEVDESQIDDETLKNQQDENDPSRKKLSYKKDLYLNDIEDPLEDNNESKEENQEDKKTEDLSRIEDEELLEDKNNLNSQKSPKVTTNLNIDTDNQDYGEIQSENSTPNIVNESEKDPTKTENQKDTLKDDKSDARKSMLIGGNNDSAAKKKNDSKKQTKDARKSIQGSFKTGGKPIDALSKQRKSTGNVRQLNFGNKKQSVVGSSDARAEDRGEAERLASLMENQQTNVSEEENDDEQDYALFEENISSAFQNTQDRRKSNINRLSIKSNRALLAKINGLDKESKEFLLQPGEYCIINEQGEIVRVDAMKPGETIETNLEKLSEAIEERNRRDGTNLVVLYHDGIDNQLYHIGDKGETSNTKDIIQEIPKDAEHEVIHKVFNNHQEALALAEQQKNGEDLRQEKRILKEGDFFVINDKGEIVDIGELNTISDKGTNPDQIAKGLKSQNEKEKTSNNIVYHDPTDREIYFISSDGKVSKAEQKLEVLRSGKEAAQKRELSKILQKIVDNHIQNGPLADDKNLETEHEFSKTREGFRDENNEILQRGDFIILTQDGHIQKIGNLQTGKQFGQNPGKIASLIRAKNQQENQKLTVLYYDPSDGELYYIDDKGKIYNSNEIQEGELKELENKEFLQKIIGKHSKARGRSNSQSFSAQKPGPFIKKGQYAIFDDKGTIRTINDLDKRESTATNIQKIAGALMKINNKEGIKHFALYHDHRTGSLLRVDESGKAQEAKDIQDSELPLENKQFIKNLIQKHADFEVSKEPEKFTPKGPSLQPGEFCVFTEDGQIKDLGEMNLGEQFRGQNSSKLAEVIKQRNKAEGSNVIALYHDPDTNELNFINKDGSLTLEKALIKDKKPLLNRPIMKKMFEDHLAAKEAAKQAIAVEEAKKLEKKSSERMLHKKERTRYLQPGEYCIITERATINELGQIELTQEFGQSQERLAGLLKTKNSNENAYLTALYHNPDDGKLYFIDKEGKITDIRELKEGFPETANSDLVKQITKQHLFAEMTTSKDKEILKQPTPFVKSGEFVMINERGELKALGQMREGENTEANNADVAEYLSGRSNEGEKITALYHEPNTGDLYFVSYDGTVEEAKLLQKEERIPAVVDKDLFKKILSRHQEAYKFDSGSQKNRKTENVSQEFLKPGEYSVINDRGEITAVGDNKINPIGENLNEIAANLRNKNLRDGTADTILYHDSDSKKIFFFDHHGIIQDDKDVYSSLVASEEDKRVDSNQEQSNLLKKKLENVKLIQPGQVYFLDHKGEIKEVAELKENGQYGSDLGEMMQHLQEWNDQNEENTTAFYLDPKNCELYYADEYGVVHNARDLKESRDEALSDEALVEKIKLVARDMKDGECRLLTENGHIKEIGKMEKGSKFGENPSQLAALMRSNNLSSNVNKQAICKDTVTGEIYLIDKDGVVHNIEDLSARKIAKIGDSGIIQKIIDEAGKLSSEDILVFDAKGEITKSGNLKQEDKFGDNLLDFANKIKMQNLQDNAKQAALYKDSTNGEVYLVDENGQVHNLEDVNERLSPGIANLGLAKKCIVDNIEALKSGTCIIINEHGAMQASGPVVKGSQFGTSLDQLSEMIRNQNEEAGSHNVGVFKDPKTQETYYIDEKGITHNQKDILNPSAREGKEFLRIQQAGIASKKINPSTLAIINEKGEVIATGEFSQTSTYGRSKEDLGEYIKSQNLMKKTEITAVYNDPKTGKTYYIDKEGALHWLGDLKETTVPNLDQHRQLIEKTKAAKDLQPSSCALFDKNGQIKNVKELKTTQDIHQLAADIRTVNRRNMNGNITALYHDPISNQQIYIDAEGRLHNIDDIKAKDDQLKHQLQEKMLQNLKKLKLGQVGVFNEDGELIKAEEVGKGQKIGETLDEAARGLKDQNQREVIVQMALFQEPTTGQVYFVDDMGSIQNIRDLKEEADKEKIPELQKILVASEKLEPGRFAIIDENGTIKHVAEMGKDSNFGNNLSQLAEQIKQNNIEIGTHNTGLFLDSATNELYVIDTEGVIHDVKDLDQKMIAANKGKYKLAKKIIAKHLASQKPTRKQARQASKILRMAKGPLLKPGQFYVLSNQGQIKDMGEFILGAEFGNQNTKKLSETIKTKNISQKTGDSALYHDPYDGQLYIIDKDGNYIKAEAALKNPENKQKKILKKVLDRHRLGENKALNSDPRKSQTLRKSQIVRKSQLFETESARGDETMLYNSAKAKQDKLTDMRSSKTGKQMLLNGSRTPIVEPFNLGDQQALMMTKNIGDEDTIPLASEDNSGISRKLVAQTGSDSKASQKKHLRKWGRLVSSDGEEEREKRKKNKKGDPKRKSYWKKDNLGNIREIEYYSDEEVGALPKKEGFGMPLGAFDKLNRSTPLHPAKMFKEKKFPGRGKYPNSPELRRRYLLDYLRNCQEENDEDEGDNNNEEKEEESSTEIAHALSNMPVTNTKFLFSRITAGNILINAGKGNIPRQRARKVRNATVTNYKIRDEYSTSPYLEFLPQMMRKEEEKAARSNSVVPSSRGQLSDDSKRGVDKKLVELVSSYSTSQASSRPRAQSSAKIITRSNTNRAEHFPQRPETSQTNARNHPDRAKWRMTQSNHDTKVGREGSMKIMDLENQRDKTPPKMQGLIPSNQVSNQESRLSADNEIQFWQTNSSRFNFE